MMYISGCKRASFDQLSVAHCWEPEDGGGKKEHPGEREGMATARRVRRGNNRSSDIFMKKKLLLFAVKRNTLQLQCDWARPNEHEDICVICLYVFVVVLRWPANET